jgi:hypothetical protein
MLTIEEILLLDSTEGLANSVALDAVAHLIDYATDHSDLNLNAKAMTWCDQLDARVLLPSQQVSLDYYRANAWANRQSSRHTERSAAWAWDQEEIQQQIFFLRRAIDNPAFPESHTVQRSQILTNLGNQFDTVGRFIDAQGTWAMALDQQPGFWMAQGNRGRGLMNYGAALYDSGHREIFALAAHAELKQALNDFDQHPELGMPSLRSYFERAATAIAGRFDLGRIAAGYHPDDAKLGKTVKERDYREWALKETLFLNPLNDLGTHPIAARDILSLPDFVMPIGEPPVLIGFFNQLKQEFVSARWLCFEGIHSESAHFSDREVLLYNTLDYPAFGLAIEKTKLAFRMAYSLFDKIAYFLNHYLKLNIPEKQVSFRGIWREKTGGPIRAQFDASENWPLRGLYWLSKDFFETSFGEVIQPDGRTLNELRNHLEHKYVKIHGILIPRHATSDDATDMFFDHFACSLSREDLERRSLRVLKLARSALIYLSLGMHHEERRRLSATNTATGRAAMALDAWQDQWKGRW